MEDKTTQIARNEGVLSVISGSSEEDALTAPAVIPTEDGVVVVGYSPDIHGDKAVKRHTLSLCDTEVTALAEGLFYRLIGSENFIHQTGQIGSSEMRENVWYSRRLEELIPILGKEGLDEAADRIHGHYRWFTEDEQRVDEACMENEELVRDCETATRAMRGLTTYLREILWRDLSVVAEKHGLPAETLYEAVVAMQGLSFSRTAGYQAKQTEPDETEQERGD